ncbi:hypothetical protein NECAME_12436 [Necator americanus]|uniref:Rab-GAP TBC domain-containing protein n=1 Tax=Necator americanus TaxID=51031 RepID=W2T034_NECAM|nr:hypothetical protein NECAME_12436 [Necator americanus]ETN75360.1 hypothetical protein NECAME_12436 [Necator americanus]
MGPVMITVPKPTGERRYRNKISQIKRKRTKIVPLMPDLHSHFNNMGFDTSMYASSWFLTLFTTSLSNEIANRIMDCFLVEHIFKFLAWKLEAWIPDTSSVLLEDHLE